MPDSDKGRQRKGGDDNPNPDRSPNKGEGTTPGGPKLNRGLMGWVVMIVGALLVLWVLTLQNDATTAVPFGTVRQQAVASEDATGNIERITFTGNSVNGEFRQAIPHPIKDGVEVKEFTAATPPGLTSEADFVAFFEQADPTTVIGAEPGNTLLVQVLVSLVPWLLILGFLWFFVFRPMRNAAGPGGMLGNFGRSKHRMLNKEITNQTFDDVAGVEEAKDEVEEIVEFLRNPKKFQRLGGRIPRGVLLVGPPGTGKTLLAKAIAGEADVPFFSISGSDFVEMFVGVGASRVRDLFKQAKDNSPCIIFLDEIDAVGRRRGNGTSSGGHDEREQTLNAILVEMDGFETNDQVIVIASTNRVDVLDPALTRPGRFDRQVQVPLPDVKGRMAILKVHARKIKLGPNVDLARLAKATPGFSGADLAAIINESALGATLAGKDYVEQEDMEEARDKVRFGRAKKSRVMDEKEKVGTAYHEAGHAVVQALEKHADPLHKVTIIPRGPYGGATMSLPEKDRHTYSPPVVRGVHPGDVRRADRRGDVHRRHQQRRVRRHPPGDRDRPEDGDRVGDEREPGLHLLRRGREPPELHRYPRVFGPDGPADRCRDQVADRQARGRDEADPHRPPRRGRAGRQGAAEVRDVGPGRRAPHPPRRGADPPERVGPAGRGEEAVQAGPAQAQGGRPRAEPRRRAPGAGLTPRLSDR